MSVRNLARTAVCCIVLVCACPASAGDATRNVLMLYSNSRLLPANVSADSGLRQSLGLSPAANVVVFDEFLDFPRFGGPEFSRTFATYLREKYSSRLPDVVIAGGEQALDFMLANRIELFPKVPVIHFAVTRAHLASIPRVPADVIGVPIELAFGRTIEQALRWHPHARHLVLVTGSSPQDREWEADLRRGLATGMEGVRIEFLAGLPTEVVLRRLRDLDETSIVFTPGYFEDGAGRNFTPVESAGKMAAVTAAPIYGAFDAFIGTGVVGGYMPDFFETARLAGRAATELLAGASPGSLGLPALSSSRLVVDWRQVQRWRIDARAIPADAVVRFRTPTFWEQYRSAVIVVALVLLLQAALIAGLLLERRRRRIAEIAVRQQSDELAHAWRVATAGELTGSIAHEINQPLAAILSNAEAAELMLDSETDKRDDLRAILADIRRDDLRASEVIRRLRVLLTRNEVEHRPFDVNEAVSEVAGVLGAETRRRGVTLRILPASSATMLVGDRIQVQQVVINLVLNAMDAVAGLPTDRRAITVNIANDADRVSVTVQDRGRGIEPADLPRLFDSFFSTKTGGMGLGLSIARTIVESHGGRIWAENVPGGGALIHVDLPASRSRHGREAQSG